MLCRATALLILFISRVYGQNCDADGIKLGDACTTHEDCNTGDCPIVHSKCSGSVCECALSYSGDIGTRICSQVFLGEACSSNETCSATTVDSECSGGVCACSPGYYEKSTRIGVKYCTAISDAASCTAGAEGDGFCVEGDVMGNMTCSPVLGVCTCPSGYVFVEEIVSCYPQSSDSGCSNCVNSGGVCYVQGSDVLCSCPTTKQSSTGDPMITGCDVGQASIGGVCQEDGSVVCADPNAECVHFGTMTKRYICQCKSGYIDGPKWGRPDITVCHEELSSREDPNCGPCNVNEGQCYDIDDDGVHDFCKCPTSRSSSDPDDYAAYCDTKHVNVTCDSDSMTVCYTPHDTQEFPDIATALNTEQSLLFIKDKIHDKNCYLTPQSAGWCIDLEYGTFLSCGTSKNELNEHTVSYTNWVILQRQREKRTVNDMYMYVYCSYDSLVNAFTGHVAVEIGEPPAVAAEGDLVQAGVRLDILDQFGNDAGNSGVILGQKVQLVANITDDKGVFQELKAEVCLASNLPDLSSPFARTTLLMYDGCPEVNSMLDEAMIFTEDAGNPKVTRTNLFSMFKFDDSEYVFFHCALRVCMEGNAAECDPSVCARRRKRSLTGLVKRSSAVDRRKMASALRKFDSDDFQVSISAVKIKRDLSQVGMGGGMRGFLPGSMERVPDGFQSSGSASLDTTTLLMVGGGVFGGLVFLVLVAIVVVLAKPTKKKSKKTKDEDSTTKSAAEHSTSM